MLVNKIHKLSAFANYVRIEYLSDYFSVENAYFVVGFITLRNGIGIVITVLIEIAYKIVTGDFVRLCDKSIRKIFITKCRQGRILQYVCARIWRKRAEIVERRIVFGVVLPENNFDVSM